MVNEFLKLEKKYNVPTTYNVVGKLFNEQPALIESILNEGQEIAFHSYNHQTDWKPEYYSNEIDLCRKTSRIPTGYRSPRSQINQSAVRTIWEKGFLWNAEGDYHTEPYFIYKGLVRLPITGDDYPLYLGEVTTNNWVQNFSRLLNSRTYIAFGLHDYIACIDPEKILQAWEKILQIGIESGALLLNFSEAADLFRRTAISRHFKSENDASKSSKYYITKSFEGIIKKEAEKINNPVIAELFFVNRSLPSSTKEFAKEIHSVPMESIIITDSESIDSNSQKDFADLIISINCIEYLYWPNLLADEIKRIGKIGATFIVTFPSSNRHFSLYNESVPERIRHYFTKDEIKEWSNQIGPGNLNYIYDILTSIKINNGNNDGESEQNLNMDKKSANRVLIGTIESKYIPSSKRRRIPVSDATFHFPNPIYESIRTTLENIRRKPYRLLRKVGKIVLKRI
jgi:hypothetical protein